MVLLIWSTLMFAVSMVTFAWFGVDEIAIEAAGDGRGGGGGGEIDVGQSKFGFGQTTAWITLGCLCFLTTLVLISFVFFWRVRDFLSFSSSFSSFTHNQLQIWKPFKKSKPKL